MMIVIIVLLIIIMNNQHFKQRFRLRLYKFFVTDLITDLRKNHLFEINRRYDRHNRCKNDSQYICIYGKQTPETVFVRETSISIMLFRPKLIQSLNESFHHIHALILI